MLTDVELNRMRERRSSDRPAGHPWATQAPVARSTYPISSSSILTVRGRSPSRSRSTRKAPDRRAGLLDSCALSYTYGEVCTSSRSRHRRARRSPAARGIPPLRTLRVFTTATPWEPIVEMPGSTAGRR